MKNKLLLISTLLFLALINTSYFWEGLLGWTTIPVILFLCLAYLVLAIVAFRNIYFLFKERFSNRKNIYLTSLLLIVLITTFLKPEGLIDFEGFEAKPLLVADREGVASCHTSIKFKSDNTFYLKSFCFGSDKQTGDFTFRNDTIFIKRMTKLRENTIYEFATITQPKKIYNNKIIGYLNLYKNETDSLPYTLFITQNKLSNY